jgi:hypothetical protein
MRKNVIYYDECENIKSRPRRDGDGAWFHDYKHKGRLSYKPKPEHEKTKGTKKQKLTHSTAVSLGDGTDVDSPVVDASSSSAVALGSDPDNPDNDVDGSCIRPPPSLAPMRAPTSINPFSTDTTDTAASPGDGTDVDSPGVDASSSSAVASGSDPDNPDTNIVASRSPISFSGGDMHTIHKFLLTSLSHSPVSLREELDLVENIVLQRNMPHMSTAEKKNRSFQRSNWFYKAIKLVKG